jgi:hypothetical protein
MTTTTSPANRQHVQDALATFVESDQNDNSYQYFRASDLQEIDPQLSGAIIGSHLPTIEDESPLASGLIVERYTDANCGPTLWTVRREEQ